MYAGSVSRLSVGSGDPLRPVPPCRGREVISALRDTIGVVGRVASRWVPTGWSGPDGAFPGGGLDGGIVHEWIGVGAGDDPRGAWPPPLAILAHLARQGLHAAGPGARAAWIGRGAWPCL